MTFYDSSIIFYNKRLLCFPATKWGIINNKIEVQVSFIYHFTTLGLQKKMSVSPFMPLHSKFILLNRVDCGVEYELGAKWAPTTTEKHSGVSSISQYLQLGKCQLDCNLHENESGNNGYNNPPSIWPNIPVRYIELDSDYLALQYTCRNKDPMKQIYLDEWLDGKADCRL